MNLAYFPMDRQRCHLILESCKYIIFEMSIYDRVRMWAPQVIYIVAGRENLICKFWGQMQNLICKKWAPVLKPHMCHFWSLRSTSFNDIYIANWLFLCVSCNFFVPHMRFCIWPLKLRMMFFPLSDTIVCSFVSPEFDTYEVVSLTFFTTYEVLHLTSDSLSTSNI